VLKILFWCSQGIEKRKTDWCGQCAESKGLAEVKIHQRYRNIYCRVGFSFYPGNEKLLKCFKLRGVGLNCGNDSGTAIKFIIDLKI
jgi:hypothetical protein